MLALHSLAARKVRASTSSRVLEVEATWLGGANQVATEDTARCGIVCTYIHKPYTKYTMPSSGSVAVFFLAPPHYKPATAYRSKAKAPAHTLQKNESLEMLGIEPRTSCMQSRRATAAPQPLPDEGVVSSTDVA